MMNCLEGKIRAIFTDDSYAHIHFANEISLKIVEIPLEKYYRNLAKVNERIIVQPCDVIVDYKKSLAYCQN
jgi:hypothetical protein